MKLYDYGPSQNGWKIRALLAMLGSPIAAQQVLIFEGQSRSPDFLARNPAGSVPVLELDDGRCLAESNAILTYLAEGTPHLPPARFERGSVMQWLFFEQNQIEPVIGSLRYWTLTGKLARRDPALVRAKRSAAERALDLLDRHLDGKQFLANDRFSIADLAVYAYAHLAADAGLDPARRRYFSAWTHRVAAQAELPPVIAYATDPYSDRELG